MVAKGLVSLAVIPHPPVAWLTLNSPVAFQTILGLPRPASLSLLFPWAPLGKPKLAVGSVFHCVLILAQSLLGAAEIPAVAPTGQNSLLQGSSPRCGHLEALWS